MEKMAVVTAIINSTAYAKLLARTLPRVITTVEENERIIAELEALDTKGRPLTPEEENLAELMTLLVRQFEESKYPLGHAEPLEALRILMEDRGLRQRDLIPVFGSSSVASDVLNGKRSISKAHARKLAESFHVTASLFI
jgi:HTH-type transcriptional regulator/antitoxin HigA